MTSFHLFQSIFDSSFQFYGLSQWLLEPMPDNVDLNRYNTNRSNHGWTFRRHNARSKFLCQYCTKSKSKKLVVNGWSSAYTTILFRARLDRSRHGQHIGRIQMKIFEQGCHLCNMYSAGIFEEKEIKKTFYRLHLWILKAFYHVQFLDDDDAAINEIYDGETSQTRRQYPHDSSRCDGCRVGWCKSLVRDRSNQSFKRHTMIF